MKRALVGLAAFGVVTVLAAIATLGTANASSYSDTEKSTNYQFVQSSLGNGGPFQSSSTNYTVNESAGDTAVGNSGSANYQVNAGSKTSADPALTFAINGLSPSFGLFSPTSTATATTSFQVTDYTSYGYIVMISGDPPSNGTHKLPGMATTGAATTGVEQFGINLVANTQPITFGANPDHGQFGFGAPTTNYATPNKFRYVSGETIASASKSSGVTTYTISYIADVSSLTPGGQYKSNQVLICVATY